MWPCHMSALECSCINKRLSASAKAIKVWYISELDNNTSKVFLFEMFILIHHLFQKGQKNLLSMILMFHSKIIFIIWELLEN